jgi:CRISPR-associated protein Cas1
MAWRGVHITQPARLSLADGQIVVSRDDGEVRLAVEDVAWMVIDTPRVMLSSALISACMDAGMLVVTTDQTHTPSGVILPFHRHHRQAEIAVAQVSMSVPLKKRLWQVIVQQKIINQGTTLIGCERDPAALMAMARLVGSGDPDNIEARAARTYWPRLFTDFIRDDASDKRNALLNYGYAVVRSAVARALVAFGLLPAFGVNHASITNAFNLADDVVEPFRPFIDHMVWVLTERGTLKDGQTTVTERQKLATCLLEKAIVGRETVSLLVATERAAESMVRAIEANSAAMLLLPRMP